jgi:pimeloyl-ACP methyl ester carboxylesterase
MKTTLQGIATILLLGVTLAACDRTPPQPAAPPKEQAAPPPQPAPPPAALAVDPLAPGEHLSTTADRNQMPYVVTGEGETTVMLIHCWMCDSTFWSNQVPVLAEQYRTITVDLPGHGKATDAREVWTIAGYGQDVAELIEALDLNNVVLVGHSMGGPVSLRAAALTGGRVRGIVAVDTLHDADFTFTAEQRQEFAAAFDPDFVAGCVKFIDQMFPEEGVEAVENHVRETSCNPQRAAIGQALMKGFGEVDMKSWFAEAGVPIRAINAAAPNPTNVEGNRKYADFDAVLMEGVGHYPHMTRPEQFNPLLLEAISEILAESAASEVGGAEAPPAQPAP